MTIFFSK